MRKLHILSQFAWPDDAPTGIYSEHLATAALHSGWEVRLCAGSGTYRPASRPAPPVEIERVPHFVGKRSQLHSVAREYLSVTSAFEGYLKKSVSPGDVAVVVSAPPTTLSLHKTIRELGGIPVYWLQDYYPDLLRGLVAYPNIMKRAICWFWESALRKWELVVRAAANLGYHGDNSVVIRNWPTLDLVPQNLPPPPQLAVYSGNLGYGHHIPSFLAECLRLQGEGFHIVVRGDGPGMKDLPQWIHREPIIQDPEKLIAAYYRASVHIVAGHPRVQTGVFPSKFWNAKATGREIIATGMQGPLLEEFRRCVQQPIGDSLGEWMIALNQMVARK